MFTEGDDLKQEGKDYNKVKSIMIFKNLKQKAKAKIIQEAVDLRYRGSYIQKFLHDAKNIYTEADFNKMTQHGLIIKEIKTDQNTMELVLIRGDDKFEKVKNSCSDYERNQNFMTSVVHHRTIQLQQ